MNQSIGKLLPVDGFRIDKMGDLTRNAHLSLTHLYQPVVGQLAISLYQLLVSEYEINEEGQVKTHHTLMSFLSVPLDKIYEARQKLEAIGLLRTYCYKEEDQPVEYLYKVFPPFSPEEFFMDSMLALLLHHELGEDKYHLLKERLIVGLAEDKTYEEVTASFDQVFHTALNHSPSFNNKDEKRNPEPLKSRGPVIQSGRVDFEWLNQALKQKMYPSEKILTGQNKHLISQLASLYNLTTLELEKAVTWAIDENHHLIEHELKAACHDFMQEKPSSNNHKSLNQREKVNDDSSSSPQTKEDQFVSMLEQISPKELLEDLSGGNRASSQDLKMIRDVMTEQGLQPGVMNVLVHYVLLKTDMKLSKPYLEKIASHWTRKNVTTVRQAMNLAKAEHQKYQQWGKQKSQRRGKQDEVIPSWYKNRKSPANKEKQSGEKVNTDEIAERIKRLTDKGNS
ncbi:replication initiation and membrane attachment family protein [Halobacillus yeomjeoni]|uniref:DnaD domain protein n=1 Tax=Halobacillus yeomjeoni TaxID=311194 RepID=A0A931MUL8_9BACI|nr:DnaD domain protein [Halobacillus yeomjeoni]MBH0230113.1 DnaD domain protein [Halobacillus yeomjeoni]